MKRLLVILASLLFLTACSSGVVTQVENADEVIAQINDTTITKGDIYTYIKLKQGVNILSVHLVEMELDKHVTLTDEDKAKADETLASVKESLGEQFEMLLGSQGFKDEEDYLNNYVLKSMKIEKLLALYLEENLAELTKELKTSKIKIVRAETKAEAEEALESLKALESITDENFKEIAEKYVASDEVEKAGVPFIDSITSGRTEDTFINNQLKNAKPGLVDEVIMNNAQFVVMYFEDLDLEADKDAIIESISSNEAITKVLTNKMFEFYAAQGNFKIHDTRLNELFTENNPFANEDQ